MVVLATVLPAQVRIMIARDPVSSATQTAVKAYAEAGIERLAPYIPGTPKREIRFVLHRDADSVPVPLRVSLQSGVPGFARLQLDEIHIVIAAIQIDPPNDLKTTVEHELVHILLDQFVGTQGRYVPRWFHEGLAQELSGDGYLGVKEEDLIQRVRGRNHIPFRDLVQGFPHHNPDRLALAYAQSYSFVAFLRRNLGLPKLLAIARQCSPDVPFHVAFARTTRKGLGAHYEDLWLKYLIDESGAGYRVILTNCFMIVCIGIVGPLLAIAVAQRRNRRLAKQDRQEDEQAEADRLAAELRLAEDAAEDEANAAWLRAEFDEDETSG